MAIKLNDIHRSIEAVVSNNNCQKAVKCLGRCLQKHRIIKDAKAKMFAEKPCEKRLRKRKECDRRRRKTRNNS